MARLKSSKTYLSDLEKLNDAITIIHKHNKKYPNYRIRTRDLGKVQRKLESLYLKSA